MHDTFYTNCLTVGNKIFYRGYDEGHRVHQTIDYQPSLFIASNKQSKFKTLDGKSVEKITFDSINEARDFIKRYDEISDFKIYGNTNFHYCYISDSFPETIDYDFDKLRVMYLDIETSYDNGFPHPETAGEPVIAITMQLGKKFYVYGTKEFTTDDKNIYYFKCEDEKDLLSRFIVKWRELDADIISGWNIEEFDIPYLVNRISRVLSEKESKRLSPWGMFKNRRITMQGRAHENIDVCGITTLDYLQMYRKFVGQAENYKLNTIAELVLGDKKIDIDQAHAYANDHQKFIEYNIKDVDLVSRIDEKMGLISMLCAIAYDAKVNIADTFAQVRLWDTIIFNDFKAKKLVLPPKKSYSKDEKYEGAYVKEVQIGLHKWVVSFDLDSLYPHLIAQFNISPEMIVPAAHTPINLEKLLSREYDLSHLKEKKMTIAANGHHFKVEHQGFLPAILMRMYADRKLYKNKMLEAKAEQQRAEAEIKRRGLTL